MVMGSVWEEVGWWVILLRGREESGVGHNGTGQVSTVAHHLLLASCNLQEICVVSHIKIQLYMFHVIWIVVTVVTYIRISTPQGAPIWTTFIGQIVVGCIQFTMPHRSGLASYVNTNKNRFVFHSIQSETWCIQNWFQGGVFFISGVNSVLLWVPVLKDPCDREYDWIEYDWCWLWLGWQTKLTMTIKISDDRVKCQSHLTFSHSHFLLAMAHSQKTPASAVIDLLFTKKYAKRKRQGQTSQ